MSTVEQRLEALVERSRTIIDRAGACTLTLQMGPRVVRLVAAGATLLDYYEPAFVHLARLDDSAVADLTVLLWDAASTEASFPRAGVEVPADPLGAVTQHGPITLAYHQMEQTISVLNVDAALAVFIVRGIDYLPVWDRPAPLRFLLAWWFASQNLLLAHSAAVSSEDGAALIVGPSGSGKSSTALGCLAAGLGYLGDDHVLLDPVQRTVSSIFGSAKLVPEHLQRFPGLMRPDAPRPHDPPDSKMVGWPSVEYPDRMVRTAPIKAFVVPVVTRGPSCRMLRSTAGRALMALAPTTMFQTPGFHQLAFSLSVDVVRGLPPYRLELGEGSEQVPSMIRRLLASGEVSR